ncbi:MAG: M23 family metallopeptidase [Rhizobium sp.]|nr:M23 family metallopeptidase [Rhizobium sp.]
MSVRSALAALALLAASPAMALELRLPADCRLGEDCFLQQFPDMKKGDGAIDPFCGIATYDGHDGVDLRVLSMKDITRAVPVVAVADGEVLRGRDGVEDRLVDTPGAREAIMPRACGNGVVIAHADGLETQYCHLRRGSIVVRPGQKLKAGDKIGEVGASGLAQFPHVHLTVRLDGAEVDPLTGRKVGEDCVADPSDARPLFSPAVMAMMKPLQPEILGLGLSGSLVDYDTLVVDGPPPQATTADAVRVAWVWLANVKVGDTLRIVLDGPDGERLTDNTTKPLDRNKAIYFSYAGKKGSPVPGSYRLDVTVLRDGSPVVNRSRQITVE